MWAGGSARCLGSQSPDVEMKQREWLERGLHTRPGLWHQHQNSLSKSPKAPHSVSERPVASGLASLLFHLLHPRSGESVQALGVLETCPHRPKPFVFALSGGSTHHQRLAPDCRRALSSVRGHTLWREESGKQVCVRTHTHM